MVSNASAILTSSLLEVVDCWLWRHDRRRARHDGQADRDSGHRRSVWIPAGYGREGRRLGDGPSLLQPPAQQLGRLAAGRPAHRPSPRDRLRSRPRYRRSKPPYRWLRTYLRRRPLRRDAPAGGQAQRSRHPSGTGHAGPGVRPSPPVRLRWSLRRHACRQLPGVLAYTDRATRRVTPTTHAWRTHRHRIPATLPGGHRHLAERCPRNRRPAPRRRLYTYEDRDPQPQPAGGLRSRRQPETDDRGGFMIERLAQGPRDQHMRMSERAPHDYYAQGKEKWDAKAHRWGVHKPGWRRPGTRRARRRSRWRLPALRMAGAVFRREVRPGHDRVDAARGCFPPGAQDLLRYSRARGRTPPIRPMKLRRRSTHGQSSSRRGHSRK